jgi:hypothetical protein
LLSGHARAGTIASDILKILDERTTAMTIQECAQLLDTDETTLARHSKTGKYPTFTIVGMIRVSPAELAAQIRGGSNNPSNSDNQWEDDTTESCEDVTSFIQTQSIGLPAK